MATLLIMYASAIFYQPDKVINTGNGWIFDINPIFMCISNFRDAVLYGRQMNMNYCMASLAIAVVTVVVGAVLFYRKQDKFILYV